MGLQAGCQTGDQKAMKAAAEALKEEDYDQATILANEALDESPKPDVAAEALYIRGRAYEQRPVSSRSALQANMQAARSAYVEALKRNPPKKLGTYIHASLGKVALYQDDFPVAIQQLSLAYTELDDKDLRAAALYHLGKAQQRAGQFLPADKTFVEVMTQYDGTPWARKAGEARGARAFYVQLGVYKNTSSAAAAATALNQRGLPPTWFRDTQQRYLLRTGPFASYTQAQQMRQRTTDLFPDATIVP
jgi:tetratricopeptide (TPR) repeat protein